jgi:hypothetical protein
MKLSPIQIAKNMKFQNNTMTYFTKILYKRPQTIPPEPVASVVMSSSMAHAALQKCSKMSMMAQGDGF